MLLGFMAVINHQSENSGYVNLLHSIISNSLGRTVDLSAQALKNALNRDYHEYIQKCLRDINEGNIEDIYISASALLGIGATSGSDIACGMYYAMSEN